MNSGFPEPKLANETGPRLKPPVENRPRDFVGGRGCCLGNLGSFNDGLLSGFQTAIVTAFHAAIAEIRSK
jgi:hypothetical protein